MRPKKLTLEQKMALRVAYRRIKHGQKVRFYREQGKLHSCCALLIQRAVLG